jgi:cysteinyl-tRNA synthetase
VKAGEEKMSKSLGNFISISEALERWPSDAIRLWVLTSHYRTPNTYTDDALGAAKRSAERLRLAAQATDGSGQGEGIDPAPQRAQFLESMDDDLNTAKAIAALHDLAREINRGRDEGHPIAEAQATLRELSDVLGLTLSEPEAAIGAAPFIELMIEMRKELRDAKQFELADKLRDRLADLGIALEDSAQGTTWRRRE